MTKAVPYLEESLKHYKKLEELTRDSYRYSNAFHGRQQVPWPEVYHWSHLLERYEQELADFKTEVASLDKIKEDKNWRVNRENIEPLQAAKFKLLTKGVETYEVKKGARVFTDTDFTIDDINPQLEGLSGIRFSHKHAKDGGEVRIEIETSEPVKVLVGYFSAFSPDWLQVPALEHVAHANERGGLDPVLEDVADLRSNTTTLPKLNVHAFDYGKGKQTIEMIGEGSYVILGIVPAK